MMTPQEFRNELSVRDKLVLIYGERVAALFEVVLHSEGNPFNHEHLQVKHSADWLHRCVMHSHWGNPYVGKGEFSPHFRFNFAGLDVIALDRDLDRFYEMCWRLTDGNPEFPPITLDNEAKSFTCPGI